MPDAGLPLIFERIRRTIIAREPMHRTLALLEGLERRLMEAEEPPPCAEPSDKV